MADSGAIAPCPEKAAPTGGKGVNVKVEAVDVTGKGEDGATQPSARKPTWRPFVHRTIPLIVLMLLALGLIGALETASRTLPSARLRGPGAAGIVTSLPVPTPTPTVSTSTTRAPQKRQDGGAPTNPGAEPVSTPSTNNDGTSTPSDVSPVTPSTSSQASPTDSSSSPVSQPASPTGSVSQTSSNNATTTSGSAAQTTTVPPQVFNNPEGNPNYVEPQISPVTSESHQTSGVAVIVANLPANYNPPEGAIAYLLPDSQLGLLGDGDPNAGGNSKLDGGSPLPPQPPRLSKVPLTLANENYNYFLGTYAPVLIAVILRHLVTPLYRYAKLVDPFERLTAPDGALFRDFYLLRHLGSENMQAPYLAYKSRRWNLFWTASLYASVQMLTPLAAELTQIRYSAYGTKQPQTQQGVHRRVNQDSSKWMFKAGQAVWIDSVAVRVIQGLLGLIFIQLVVVWYRLWKTEPSLPANPASIATIASLTGHPQTARDFSRIDQQGEMRITMGRFRDRRYRLESYTTRDGTEGYGLVPKGGKIRAPPPPKKEEDSPDTSSAKNKQSGWRRVLFWQKKKGTPKPHSNARIDLQNLGIVTVGTGTLFGLVLAYILTKTQTKFELFMDSQQFGPRFILSTLALCLKSPLRSLWMSTTAALPWQRLADSRPRGGGASVRDVMEPVPVTFTPLGGLAYALRRGEWFAMGLSLSAGLAAEVLIVLLPGVPYTSRQLFIAAQVNWYGSIACLGLILLVTIFGWLRMARLRGRPSPWPRAPVSVGIVASYVAGSDMAKDFVSDPKSVAPPTTRYQFREKNGRWLVDYAHEEEPE